jgi:Mycobacterial cell wall arabinan synthesis protein
VTRSKIALLLAVVAVSAAVVGALGPAKSVRTTYSWPPRTMPATTPSRLWYTPLLLIHQQPDELSVRFGCSPTMALPGAARPITILATARNPASSQGLAITRRDNMLIVAVGVDELARVRVRGTSGGACAYDFQMGGGRWRLEGRAQRLTLGGDLGAMPFVDGLFSALDLRSAPRALAASITTRVHATDATSRQTAAWIVALLCSAVSLALLALVPRRAGRVRRTAALVARSFRSLRFVDAAVAGFLVVWWVIGPAFYDDGWIITRQGNFPSSHGFSNYYDSFGANLPLGYWLEWLQHWTVEGSHELVILRVPALVCLAFIWVVIRWTFARLLLTASPNVETLGLWALASAFAVGAASWGMTLRPEPVIALLVACSLACAVRFAERGTTAPVALAVVVVALAVSEHPAGLVAAAPLLAVAPELGTWGRRRVAGAVSLILSGTALTAVLVFIGSDFRVRLGDAQALRTYDENASWRDELLRYSQLLGPHEGTPLRRASVALMALTVIAFVFRRRLSLRTSLDIPATGLLVSLLLLIATPSKRTWHFGTLIAIAAVAVAAETVRLRSDARAARGWSARPLLVIGAAMLAIAWSWAPRGAWADFDLRTLQWTLGFESRITLAKAASFLPLALLLILGVTVLLRQGRNIAWRVPWQVAGWTAPLLVIPLLVFTAGVLIADGFKTDSWTLARQNVDALNADGGCGLADAVLVVRESSMRPLTTNVRTTAPSWAPAAPLRGLPVLGLGRLGSRAVRSPWFRLPHSPNKRVGLFVAGAPQGSSQLSLEWGRRAHGSVATLGSDDVSSSHLTNGGGPVVWQFLDAADLPTRRTQASLVRLVLRSTNPAANALALTYPVAYVDETLTDRIQRSTARTLVSPNLLAYLPCALQPKLQNGVAQIPAQIVALNSTLSPVIGDSANPFNGLVDLYELHELSFSDSQDAPDGLVMYSVEHGIPGAALAPPDTTVRVA